MYFFTSNSLPYLNFSTKPIILMFLYIVGIVRLQLSDTYMAKVNINGIYEIQQKGIHIIVIVLQSGRGIKEFIDKYDRKVIILVCLHFKSLICHFTAVGIYY